MSGITQSNFSSACPLLDKNVAFQIYDAELNPVLDTTSDAYEDLLLFYRTAVKYDNYDKTVYTCKLTAGNYYMDRLQLTGQIF